MTATPHNKLPRKVRLEALRLRDTGASFAAVAAQCTRRFKVNVSEAIVRKWCKQRDAEISEARAADETPRGIREALESLDPSDAPPAEGDTIAELRALMREQQELARRAKADGNTTAAARALKAAGDAANTLARLEARRAEATDGALVITKEDAERNRAAARALAAGYAADLERTGGPVCSACGRRLRIEIASNPTPTKG